MVVRNQSTKSNCRRGLSPTSSVVWRLNLEVLHYDCRNSFVYPVLFPLHTLAALYKVWVYSPNDSTGIQRFLQFTEKWKRINKVFEKKWIWIFNWTEQERVNGRYAVGVRCSLFLFLVSEVTMCWTGLAVSQMFKTMVYLENSPVNNLISLVIVHDGVIVQKPNTLL